MFADEVFGMNDDNDNFVIHLIRRRIAVFFDVDEEEIEAAVDNAIPLAPVMGR